MADVTDISQRGPAPTGSQRLTVFMAVNDCAKAIEFYTDVFGAEVVDRFEGPDGSVPHADLRLGGCVLQVGDPSPSMGLVAPPAEGNNFTLTFWTSDVDAVFAKAVDRGATVLSEVDDVFSGDRMGLVRCPFGIRWNISRHDRDVPAEEIHAAVDAWLANQ